VAVHLLLLAAGASSRMRGADKLTEPAGGEPLLRRVARRALATGLPVTALLAPDRPERRRALAGLDLRAVTVEDAGEGISASLRAGLAALPDRARGALVLMGDMPEIETADLAALAARFEALGADRVVRAAAADGTPGAPSVIPRRLFPALSALRGDMGGRAAMRGETVELLRLEGDRALVDLDTPEDWAAWRARQAKG
jgi:CTP:molybdopterin cytidylyltransferase MocA